MSLGGLVCIRNGFELDYCWREAVKSLLPICNEVVICDCDSTDGTKKWIDDWSMSEPKINPVNYKWTDPRGDTNWYPEWINYARQHLKTDWFIHLDADEVIHEDDHHLIEQAARNQSVHYCKRLNFWRDTSHLVPEGVCLGIKVLRIAGTNMPIPSDYPYEPAGKTEALATKSEIRIFHYGFLRHREAFFRKARAVQRIWADDFDPRLESAEKGFGNWMEFEGVVPWKDQLTEYKGGHPEIIKPWLRERGF